MSHYTTKNIVRETNYAWLGVGATIGKLVNEWSLRQDLAVQMTEVTQSGAPAAFNPASAEIEIDINRAFGAGVKPEEIGNLNTRKCQLSHAKATGAVFHEALHARVSRWNLVKANEDLSAREFRFLNGLEEGRIEAWGVRFINQNRVFLRACALGIVLNELEEQLEQVSKVDAAAFLALLTLARVDAGVLEESDIVQPVRDIVNSVLSPEVVAKLSAIWREFQSYDDHSNALPLYGLTREFLKVLDERKEETGEDESQEPGEGGTPGQPGQPGQGGGKGQPTPEQIKEFKEFVESVKEAVKEAQDETQVAVQSEADEAIEDEERKEQVEAHNESVNQRNEAKNVAKQVFDKNVASGSTVTDSTSRSRLIETRTPKGEELSAANRIAALLRKAKYRERSQTVTQNVTPPGRLRTRAIVQGKALAERGVRQQTEAWRRTQRKHNEDPTLNVGVIVDISGSMKAAMNPMAITAWVMSEAVRRVQGKCAMVYCGQDVFPTLRPGQRLDKVNVYTAPDSTEEFEKAFLAIDGAMNLTHADGARLLVIVSDGKYRSEQKVHAKRLLKKADKAGVAILWLTFDGKVYDPADLLKGTSGKVVELNSDESPTKAASLIGQAAADALSAIGRRG